jgi:hypothetical protein
MNVSTRTDETLKTPEWPAYTLIPIRDYIRAIKHHKWRNRFNRIHEAMREAPGLRMEAI